MDGIASLETAAATSGVLFGEHFGKRLQTRRKKVTAAGGTNPLAVERDSSDLPTRRSEIDQARAVAADVALADQRIGPAGLRLGLAVPSVAHQEFELPHNRRLVRDEHESALHFPLGLRRLRRIEDRFAK